MEAKYMSSGKKIVNIARPVVGIQGINNAVRALFAYKGAAFYKDLAAAANLNEIYMSQALSSSRDVGLTARAGKRGMYKLFNQGEEYARLLSFGKESECRELIRKIILKNPMWSEIITFLRVSKGQARNPLDLVLDVERKLGKRWSTTMRAKIGNVYSSILEYAGLISVEKGKMISQIGLEEEILAPAERPREVMRKPAEEAKVPVAPKEFAEFSLPDSFILYIRKDIDALEFFEKQVRKESMLVPWIQFVKSQIAKKEDETQ